MVCVTDRKEVNVKLYNGKDSRIEIRVTDSNKEKINRYAKENGMSVSAYMTEVALSQCQSRSMKDKRMAGSVVRLQQCINDRLRLADGEDEREMLNRMNQEMGGLWATLSSQKKITGLKENG